MDGWWWYLAYGLYYTGFVVMGLTVVAIMAVLVVVLPSRSTRERRTRSGDNGS